MKGNTSGNSFYKMIENLFLTNKLVLFGRINVINSEQEQEVLELLEIHYNNESIGYPNIPPPFEKEAASWSSKILFHAAQLVMYREHSGETLESFFPTFTPPKSAAAIITADLSFRYLSSILKYLEQIDIEDELIQILKNILTEWHYSGLLSDNDLEVDDLELIISNNCLKNLYVDRIIKHKRNKIAQRKEVKQLVLTALGNYKNEFWKDFNEPI